jgi:hypothetical protein
VRRAGVFKSDVPTLGQLMANARKAGINYAVRGRNPHGKIAHTVAHLGSRSQMITGIHPTKKATPGRMATVSLFL